MAKSIQEEVDSLNVEYKKYIDRLRAEWLRRKRINSYDVYEVMRPDERAQVHELISEWGRYVTPHAEAWWKERGYGVFWPDDNSKPMKVYRLDP